MCYEIELCLILFSYIYIYICVGGCARIYVSCSLKNIKNEKKKKSTLAPSHKVTDYLMFLTSKVLMFSWNGHFFNERKMSLTLLLLTFLALSVVCAHTAARIPFHPRRPVQSDQAHLVQVEWISTGISFSVL